MRYKILGKTGLRVSELAFGAIQITRIDERKAIEIVRSACDEGINLIDTANSYFNSEEILGRALKGIRKNIHIITKSVKRNKNDLIADLNLSLKRLNTDYIDIYLFHFISREKELEDIETRGMLEALIKERQKGKIGHIGISCHHPKVIEKFMENKDYSVIMIPVNFLTEDYIEEPYYGKYLKNNIGLLAMKPFGGGRLFDIGLCFKFLRLYPEVVTVAGMQSLEELSQNIGYAGNDDVPDSNDRKKIKEIYDELGTRFCRECWYCMPCAKKKIEIPTINFIEVFYKQFPEEEFWNMDLDKKVDAARQCTECGKCSEKCPFELDVPQIIRHNIAFYDSLKNKK